jgi:polysaccharide pyruvyl transferase WcaK-like protein
MKVLVYGWYHQGNIGDDLFIQAYQYLFPNLQFTFTEVISVDTLQDIGAVFFGGGSFLLDRPRIDDEALLLLKTKKIFYLGVGVEGVIHSLHLELMSQALLIATRSPDQVERLKSINPRVLLIPDLVYCLQPQVATVAATNKSVLFLPNVSVLPHASDPYWKHAAWAHFKSECSQFLDWLLHNGCQVNLFAMCRAAELDDNWPAVELIGHMDKRSSRHIIQPRPTPIQQITALFSQYETIITQRFHGIVLSEMIGSRYISIHHHDKLKPSQSNAGQFLSYYNVSKHTLIESFKQTRLNSDRILPLDTHIFETLVQEVLRLL